MACSACEENRRRFLRAFGRIDIGGMTNELVRAVEINAEKVKPMLVKFTQPYFAKPRPSVTTRYREGWAGDVPENVAQDAIAKGAAIAIDEQGNEVKEAGKRAPETKSPTAKKGVDG